MSYHSCSKALEQKLCERGDVLGGMSNKMGSAHYGGQPRRARLGSWDRDEERHERYHIKGEQK